MEDFKQSTANVERKNTDGAEATWLQMAILRNTLLLCKMLVGVLTVGRLSASFGLLVSVYFVQNVLYLLLLSALVSGFLAN